ncbi:MAG: hypothetical protein QM728_10835 [Gordonia sp. (in: high G+C Gram-positive bacteria)]|uniref:hypothetical protein n=1 Tax=Gordonia sp. (in: high G+C Gram-positive bacteria) TaxID=84139 RepID=UPI0039E41DA9
MNWSDYVASHAFRAVRLWEGHAVPTTDLANAQLKPGAAISRALERFSDTDHPM